MNARVTCVLTLTLLASMGAASAQQALPEPSPTNGIGDVTSVESKARQILANRAEIEQRKIEYAQLEDAWRRKIAALRAELSALYEERDRVIADLLAGRFCSKCGRPKTELDKAEGFLVHLQNVQGVPLPAPPEKIQ